MAWSAGGCGVDVKEYITVRRAYNIVRQKVSSVERLTFEELAVLALLSSSAKPVPTSSIANWQHALRPTMTHRANHLAALDLIARGEGQTDRRNVVCTITEKGEARLAELCSEIRQVLAHGKVLTRIDSVRIKQYLLAMGQYYVQASDLVLVSLAVSPREGVPIALIVGALGLLQPTVSMSVQALEERGLAKRDVPGAKAVKAYLTDAGRMRAEELIMCIEALVVKRRPRTSSKTASA